MADIRVQNDIFKEIDSFLEEIGELVEEKKDYAKLHKALSIIESQEHKKALQEILDQVQRLKENEYTPKAHFKLIEKYKQGGQILRTKLLPDTYKRFKSLVLKEVKFLQMEDSNFQAECGLTVGTIGNMIPIEGEPVKQELYLNALLNLIIDFRLKTLPDKQAWDFVAQSILEDF